MIYLNILSFWNFVIFLGRHQLLINVLVKTLLSLSGIRLRKLHGLFPENRRLGYTLCTEKEFTIVFFVFLWILRVFWVHHSYKKKEGNKNIHKNLLASTGKHFLIGEKCLVFSEIQEVVSLKCKICPEYPQSPVEM